MGKHSYWPVHAHSKFSWLDGMPTVEDMGSLVAAHGQSGFALTDHGVMSGVVRLYKVCKEYNLAPFPGIEWYVVQSLDKDADRYHTGMLALDYTGYKAMVTLNNMACDSEHYHRKPRITMKELLEFGKKHGKHVALTTGCYFSPTVQALAHQGEKAARTIVKLLAASYPNLYVELQHHNIDHGNGVTDWDIAATLYGIANDLGLPVVIGQDSHYCEKGDKPAHNMMKRLGYGVDDDSDSFFPGDTYHLATTPYMRKMFAGLRDAWDAADEGHADLLAKSNLRIPALEKYQFLVPDIGHGTGNAWLKRMVTRRATTVKVKQTRKYAERIAYELDIIEQMGFANYFLLIEGWITRARSAGILVNTRGSANGSLVCYVLGITNVDPMKWGISFDRFLHPSRKKPPDIDLDIDRDRRPEALAILGARHGVVPIGTYARLTDTEDRGAIFIKYVSYRKKIGKPVDIESLRDLDVIAPGETRVLRSLAEMDVFTGGGTHAAGYIIDTNAQPINEHLPMMRVGGINGNVVTQLDDGDCEDFGYVKVDALGLAALTTCATTLTLLGRDPSLGLGWIPDNDNEACKLLRTGETGTGIFQFEGYTTAIGARRMGVKSTKDAILALALFRPAAMHSGHTHEYLAFRKGIGKPVYLHDVFKQATSDTYGVFVMQDQVLDVLRLIGMSMDDLNDMLKAVKMSNHNTENAEAIFSRLQSTFVSLCIKIGMSKKDSQRAWKKVMDFSEYGFNKAHATSYGLLAYRMAWLKAHHVHEFMAGLLSTWAGTPKEAEYLRAARASGVRIGKPDVNVSGVNWTLDTRGPLLRRGLLSVSHVGERAAQEIIDQRPFSSVADLIERCDGSGGMVTGGKSWVKKGTLNGALGHLNDAGALKALLEKEND